MANEFRHIDAGTQLTYAEYHLITGHQFESQATGDTMYASSATQLSRLAKGAANTVLVMGASIPAWSATLAGLTLTSPTINGTINTTGLTLPAHTSEVITLNAGDAIYRNVANSYLNVRGTTAGAGQGAYVVLYGVDHGSTGAFSFITPNAAGDADVARLSLSGKAATAVAAWSNITHTGLVLSAPLDVAGQYVTFLERAAPGAGAANEVRMYAVVGGDTFTDLSAVFQDGSIDNFATETTPDNSPLFLTPSRTKLEVELRKDHPGVVRIVAIFPNGEEFDLKHHEYHDPRKIAANVGAESPLPKDWLIEDAQQRLDRLEAEEAERQAKLTEMAIADKPIATN